MVLFLVQRWHQHPPSRPSLDVRADAAGLLSRLLATPIPATRAESASRLSPHLRSDSVASHLCGCSALHRSTCPRFATHKKAGLASRSLHQITHLWACNCNSQLPPLAGQRADSSASNITPFTIKPLLFLQPNVISAILRVESNSQLSLVIPLLYFTFFSMGHTHC